ncbi:MAG: magnesium transporter CorA family protein [Proteobacteria bacterium]|nr:magnesium transporter CorA family protein [Pseudomonadota bacterium]
MRIFRIQGERFDELADLPETLPPLGYFWVGTSRDEFGRRLGDLQSALQRCTGGTLVDLHVSDLLNSQLPSHYDYTSWYDVLVFRRLAAEGVITERGEPAADEDVMPPSDLLERIDTSAVGFALFDRVLLTVHSNECLVREYFANRLQSQAATDARGAARMPPGPADLMLRMVNHMVDSYLELRRLLTRHLDGLQRRLFDPHSDFRDWQTLLDSRNTLHLLEDTCEDQRAAITEWIDGLDELDRPTDGAAQRERDLLRVRSRDVLEHIERVLTHVRRLESSAENAVQMHFSAQSHRTNDIMRALTVLTAIFLPLNLVTGFFGMNFEGLPLIHSATGFWGVVAAMFVIGVGLSFYFRRKRYLGPSR